MKMSHINITNRIMSYRVTTGCSFFLASSQCSLIEGLGARLPLARLTKGAQKGCSLCSAGLEAMAIESPRPLASALHGEEVGRVRLRWKDPEEAYEAREVTPPKAFKTYIVIYVYIYIKAKIYYVIIHVIYVFYISVI